MFLVLFFGWSDKFKCITKFGRCPNHLVQNRAIFWEKKHKRLKCLGDMCQKVNIFQCCWIWIVATQGVTDTERSLNNSILNLQYLRTAGWRDQIGSCLLGRMQKHSYQWVEFMKTDKLGAHAWWVSTPALSKLMSISKLQTNPFGKYIFRFCAKNQILQ